MADEEGFFDDWPKWSKPVFALSAMILLGGVWIGIPLMSAWKLGIDSAQAGVQLDYEPMIATLVAMTTATIAGIFVFMTFRIDRGTRLKAERVAKEKVDEIVKKKFAEFDEESKKKVDGKLDELTSSDAVKSAIQNRIPEEKFRDYVQAVLFANTNGELVAQYARERAKGMDRIAVEALLGLLRETTKHVAQCAKAKRKENRKERWTRTKKSIAKWWRGD